MKWDSVEKTNEWYQNEITVGLLDGHWSVNKDEEGKVQDCCHNETERKDSISDWWRCAFELISRLIGRVIQRSKDFSFFFDFNEIWNSRCLRKLRSYRRFLLVADVEKNDRTWLFHIHVYRLFLFDVTLNWFMIFVVTTRLENWWKLSLVDQTMSELTEYLSIVTSFWTVRRVIHRTDW